MWVKVREFLIDASGKIDDFLQRPSEKKKRKLAFERSTAKEKRLTKDSQKKAAVRSKQTTSEPSTTRLIEPTYAPESQQYAPQPQNIGVWTGVKIGCGMFIVLPLIIGGIFLLIAAVPTCTAIREVKEKAKQQADESAPSENEQNEITYQEPDSNNDGTVTKEEFLDEAYNEGYVVGLSKHDNNDDTLPDKNIELMLGDCPSSEKLAWKKGYADGFTGKKRGGKEDLPKLPELPIKIDTDPNLFYVELPECGKQGPLPTLEAIVNSDKEGYKDKDLFIVDAIIKYTEHCTEYKRLIYDKKERIYLQLTTRKMAFMDDSNEWVLMLDLAADQLTDKGLWYGDSEHRKIRSDTKKGNSHSIPLVYTRKTKICQYPEQKKE
jgi:hypothetical protein